MYNFQYFIVLALMGVFTCKASAQQECVGIKNDISRLQCFDRAFPDTPDITPTNAVQRLNDLSIGGLIASGDAIMYFKTKGTNCSLQVMAFVRGNHFSSLGLEGFRADRHQLNLADVTDITPSRSSTSIRVSLRSGTVVDTRKVSWAFDANLFRQEYSVNDLNNYDVLSQIVSNNEDLARRYNDFWVTENSARTEDIRLVAEEEDLREASGIFRSYVAACSER
jgi:hypothetical protein